MCWTVPLGNAGCVSGPFEDLAGTAPGEWFKGLVRAGQPATREGWNVLGIVADIGGWMESRQPATREGWNVLGIVADIGGWMESRQTGAL